MRWLSSDIWRRLRGRRDAAPQAPLDTVSDIAAGVPARLAAVDVLHTSGGPLVVAALCAALDDAYPAVRHRAAGILGRLGDQAAVDPLCRRLWHILRDPKASFDDVGSLVDALSGFTGDPRPVEPLRAALLDERSYRSWSATSVDADFNANLADACIASALRKLGGRRLVIDGYAGALRHDDEYFRRRVADHLAGIAWRAVTPISSDYGSTPPGSSPVGSTTPASRRRWARSATATTTA
ncbi:hypothetical protein GCM10022225_79680 [Plantactinospora mayteni]|uniref:HEAT repeat domain-containing protein n=1 Tax=Plantactinospora mayteni TaxID=566021 RepID=A0ABQ4F3D1_9ACTN|nr:HEAT repeat domain-containing protein [Plantactinospora mayteni]GIH01424.1 hypothetical protein Pma05_79960 [Plantactinospora mayteni]